MDPRKYTTLAQELHADLEGLAGCGPAVKLAAAVQETAAFLLAQLDRHPELKLGARFMLLGTAKALASRWLVSGCLGRPVTPREEETVEEAAVAIARVASEIRLP